MYYIYSPVQVFKGKRSDLWQKRIGHKVSLNTGMRMRVETGSQLDVCSVLSAPSVCRAAPFFWLFKA